MGYGCEINAGSLCFNAHLLTFMFLSFNSRFKSPSMHPHRPILGNLLGSSGYLSLDPLTSISCHLRASGGWVKVLDSH